MTVFDVVSIVDPSADTSRRKGRHLVYFFTRPSCGDPETTAHSFAQTCRNCCHTPGITYEVEQHDELSPARAHYESDCKAPEGCYCAGAKWES